MTFRSKIGFVIIKHKHTKRASELYIAFGSSFCMLMSERIMNSCSLGTLRCFWCAPTSALSRSLLLPGSYPTDSCVIPTYDLMSACRATDRRGEYLKR